MKNHAPTICSFFVSLFVLSVSLTADQAKPEKNPKANGEKSTWAMPIPELQKQLLQYLATKNGSEIPMPIYPKDGVVKWSRQKYDEAKKSKEPNAIYSWVYENSLVAQNLVQQKELRSRRQGMIMARNANTIVFIDLKDKWLYARIHEAFLLPYLSAADDERWENLSRQRIVEGACNAFEATGEREKQIAMLRYLIQISEEDDFNTIDWARGQLAQALAATGNYKEAIEQLETIQSEEMSEIKKFIVEYQKKLEEQKATKQVKQ